MVGGGGGGERMARCKSLSFFLLYGGAFFCLREATGDFALRTREVSGRGEYVGELGFRGGAGGGDTRRTSPLKPGAVRLVVRVECRERARTQFDTRLSHFFFCRVGGRDGKFCLALVVYLDMRF